MLRYTVNFSGQVQGVGFRYATLAVAKQFKVSGSVGNLTDGRVLVVAEGDQVELDGFIRAIGDQMSGYISGHTVVRCTATGEFGRRFVIR